MVLSPSAEERPSRGQALYIQIALYACGQCPPPANTPAAAAAAQPPCLDAGVPVLPQETPSPLLSASSFTTYGTC